MCALPAIASSSTIVIPLFFFLFPLRSLAFSASLRWVETLGFIVEFVQYHGQKRGEFA
jgi:hypothetical protein